MPTHWPAESFSGSLFQLWEQLSGKSQIDAGLRLYDGHVMTGDTQTLYVFLHVPKCAGTSFCEHVRSNLDRDAVLFVSPTPDRRFETKSELDEYLHALPTDKKASVKIVLGHSVYCGIHTHFDRPGKYFTFLRNPVRQALSLFDYVVANYETFKAEDVEGRLPKDKTELTLQKWGELFDMNTQIPIVLNYKINGRVGLWSDIEMTAEHLEAAKHVLDSFYFVGLTESFQEDSFFMYNELGFNKLLRMPLNVNPKQRRELDPDIVNFLSSRLSMDKQLYEHAVKLNAQFKSRRPDFSGAVESVQARAKMIRPFRLVAKEVVTSMLGVRAHLWLTSVKSKMLARGISGS